MPSTEFIAPDDLTRLVSDVFCANGMSTEDASEVARVLVWAEASGHRSHGILRVDRYLDFIRRGALVPNARPYIGKDAGALLRIDADRAAGAVAMHQARDVLSARAAEHGIALGLVANTTHIGAAGYHALKLAGSDRIGIVMAGGVPLMAYHGAAPKSLSTAPLAIAVPAADRPPLLLDMASSEVALGKIKKAQREGNSIPKGWALTADGEPTTNPAEAEVLLPMAGPKGSGLALMIECLSGILSGAPALLGRIMGTDFGHTQNAMAISIDIGQICDADQFRSDVSALAGALEALPKAHGTTEILMPGARSAKARTRSAEVGISVESDELVRLGDLGANA